jgi:hypothetical protein
MKTLILIFLALTMTLSGWSEDAAILEARLHALSSDSHELKVSKIQPGSIVKLQAEIKNSGTQPSAPGSIAIRFVLIEPLEDLLGSRTFFTESHSFPSIHPGQVIVVNFDRPHQWPSLTDFIRQNWNMRHYQAVVKIDGDKNEKVIGYLPVFFSAHYYEGPAQPRPQYVPRKQDEG